MITILGVCNGTYVGFTNCFMVYLACRLGFEHTSYCLLVRTKGLGTNLERLFLHN